MNDFNVSLREIQGMMPYELEIYVALLQKSQQQKMRQMNKK